MGRLTNLDSKRDCWTKPRGKVVKKGKEKIHIYCVKCGKPITDNRRRKYCSAKCAELVIPQNYKDYCGQPLVTHDRPGLLNKCEFCHKPITRASANGSKFRYCSDECRADYNSSPAMIKYKRKYAREQAAKHRAKKAVGASAHKHHVHSARCPICFVEFPADKGKDEFCSDDCSTISDLIAKARAKAKKAGPIIYKTCAWCGDEFEVGRGRGSNKRVCCKESCKKSLGLERNRINNKRYYHSRSAEAKEERRVKASKRQEENLAAKLYSAA